MSQSNKQKTDSLINDEINENETIQETSLLCFAEKYISLKLKIQVRREWKRRSDKVMKDLSEIVEGLEADHAALDDNTEKVERYSACIVRSMQQEMTAYKNKLEALQSALLAFKKECEEIDAEVTDEIQKIQQ